MFFMPEYYPLQILLSGAFPENFLSAALGRSVGAAAEESRGGAIINYQTRTRTNWFPNSASSRRSSSSASATAIDGNGSPRSAARRRAATSRSSVSVVRTMTDNGGERRANRQIELVRCLASEKMLKRC